MRLGVVGLLPRDFRTLESPHLQTIQNLGFTGGAFHFPAELCEEITTADTDRCRARFAEHNLDLAQFSITYPECLFDPDPEIRNAIIRKIKKRNRNRRGPIRTNLSLAPRQPQPRRKLDAPSSKSHHRSVGSPHRNPARNHPHPRTTTASQSSWKPTSSPSSKTRKHAAKWSKTSDRPTWRLVMDYVNHFETLSQVYDSTDRLGPHLFRNGCLFSGHAHQRHRHRQRACHPSRRNRTRQWRTRPRPLLPAFPEPPPQQLRPHRTPQTRPHPRSRCKHPRHRHPCWYSDNIKKRRPIKRSDATTGGHGGTAPTVCYS